MSEPKLPDPPWRVYGRVLTSSFEQYCKYPRWYQFYNREWLQSSQYDSMSGVHMKNFEVIPHPRNDPEAVELIRKAKEPK